MSYTDSGMRPGTGHLELIIGPMFASKSTEVIRRVNRFRAKNFHVLVVNHSLNARYGSKHITTHDEVELQCSMIVTALREISDTEDYKRSEIIVIEELQFFEDALEFVTTAIDRDNKIVIGAGLIADYKKEKFGQVLDLIPHAEEITHLKAYCSRCTDFTEGAFTKRLVNSKEQTLVGTHESYITVCRRHYLED